MQPKRIHFIGIGGISMSGIANILYEEGYSITGSDANYSENVENLINKGIKVTIGEDPSLIKNADIIVYTAAIKKDNKELEEAYKLQKEVYERAEFLGLMQKEYQNVLCISGTHGKSTTTGMISCIFLNAKKNPTIQLGAILPKINANYFVGGKEYFINESCEYVDSFLHFNPTSAIILNIDDDHLDYFKNIDNIKKSFTNFSKRLPNNGNLIINADDKNTMSLNYPQNINIITYGINNNANVQAKNISYNNGHPVFDIYYNNKYILTINLSILGNHNIYNALAAFTMASIYNIDKESIIKGINNYTGVGRRMEYLGKYHHALVYDDYAHHPTEINATYNAVKNISCHQNWAIFQSHTYSRTKEHLEEFANVLKQFDNIIIAPIYAAREINVDNVKEEDLVNLIKKDNPNVCYIDSFDKILTYLKENIQDNDLVISIGAGPINKVTKELIKNE